MKILNPLRRNRFSDDNKSFLMSFCCHDVIHISLLLIMGGLPNRAFTTVGA